MPNALTILASRSNHDTPTSYAYYYSSGVLDRAKKMGYNVIDLAKSQDTRANLASQIPTNPLFYFGSGHGNYTKFGGQNLEILLEKDVNENWMQDRIVFLVSCETGKELGPALIQNGAKAFIGWKERFWWVVGPPYIPALDIYAKGFLETTVLVAKMLIEGKSVQEAFDAGIASFNKWIDYWEHSPDDTASLVISGLLDNIDNFVVFGDRDAKIESGLLPVEIEIPKFGFGSFFMFGITIGSLWHFLKKKS